MEGYGADKAQEQFYAARAAAECGYANWMALVNRWIPSPPNERASFMEIKALVLCLDAFDMRAQVPELIYNLQRRWQYALHGNPAIYGPEKVHRAKDE